MGAAWCFDPTITAMATLVRTPHGGVATGGCRAQCCPGSQRGQLFPLLWFLLPDCRLLSPPPPLPGVSLRAEPGAQNPLIRLGINSSSLRSTSGIFCIQRAPLSSTAPSQTQPSQARP